VEKEELKILHREIAYLSEISRKVITYYYYHSSLFELVVNKELWQKIANRSGEEKDNVRLTISGWNRGTKEFFVLVSKNKELSNMKNIKNKVEQVCAKGD